jgi:hypothetical protein
VKGHKERAHDGREAAARDQDGGPESRTLERGGGAGGVGDGDDEEIAGTGTPRHTEQHE